MDIISQLRGVVRPDIKQRADSPIAFYKTVTKYRNKIALLAACTQRERCTRLAFFVSRTCVALVATYGHNLLCQAPHLNYGAFFRCRVIQNCAKELDVIAMCGRVSPDHTPPKWLSLGPSDTGHG